MQDIDAAPAPLRIGHHRLEVGALGDVGLERRRDAFLGGDHIDRLLGGGQIVIDAQDLGAFARKGQRGGAAVADAFAGALSGADDDGDTIFQAHLIPLPGSGTAAVPLCNRVRCRSSSVASTQTTAQ
jgi:hypothetical protein